MPRRKTHEEFIKEATPIIKDRFEILETYVNNTTKLKCRCLKDGYEWKTTPKAILIGKGCPKCGGTLKLSPEEFHQRMSNINSNIELLSSYIDMKHKVRCKCLVDGNEWEAFPENLLKGHGCHKCSINKSIINLRKSHDDFISEIHKISPTIKILNNYIDNKTVMKCFCEICGNEWETAASNLLARKGCPRCAIKKRAYIRRKTQEHFIKELEKVNPDIIVLGKYINSTTKILCKCKIDGYEWHALPLNLLRGTGCPKCHLSHGERLIRKILTDLNIDFKYQYRFDDCKNIRPLPFDFYIENLNLCIEYDGEQHYFPVKFNGCSDKDAISCYERTQQNDLIKNEYCNKNNIKLLRIKYTEFKNIENIIQEYLAKYKCIIMSQHEMAE